MNSKASNKKTFVFISRTAPYGSNRPQLCLDAAFAAAVFEQDVTYLFMGDGVYQLLANQNADGINSKSLGNALETLDLYGIEKVMVEADALQQRGLDETDLAIAATLVQAAEISLLIAESDCVVNL